MKPALSFIALVVVLSGGSLFAQGIPADAPPEVVLKVVLDLSEDQLIAIQELVEARAVAVEPIAGELHILQRELEEALTREVPDPLVVGELVLAVRSLQQRIALHHEDFREGFRSLLTPEQAERVGHIIRVALANRAAEALSQLGLR